MKKGKDSGKGPPPKANGKSTTPPTTPAKSRGGITVMNRSGTPPPSGGITLIGKKAEGLTLIGKNAEANGGITLIGKKAEQNGVPTPVGKKADAAAGISLIRKSQSSNELPPQGLPPSGRPASQASSSGNAPEVALVRRSHSATDIAAQEMEELRLYSEEEVQDTAKMWVHLTEGASVGERQGAAAALAGQVKANGIASLEAGGLVAKIAEGLQDSKNPLVREGSLRFIRTLSEVKGSAVEPVVVPMLPQVLMLYCDKWVGVRSAAEAAATEVVRKLNKHAVKATLPIFFDAMESPKFWQAQEGSLKLIGLLAETAPDQLRAALPEVVPRVSNYVADGKKQVMEAAYAALDACFSIVGNRDIAHVIPDLVSCVARPGEVPQTVHKLSGTTFVQTVTSSTLSVLVPLLVRGLKERTTLDKRRTVVVIENMSKLVKDAVDAAPFIPQLLPGLEKVSNEVADPECRERAGVAHSVLFNIDKEAKAIMNDPENQARSIEPAAVIAALKEVLPADTGAAAPDLFAKTLDYVAALCVLLLKHKSIEFEEWSGTVSPYLAPYVGSMSEAEKATRALVKKLEGEADDDSEEEQDDEEGEDLCNVRFSLGYGGKILLNNSRLHLKRNRRYGLCGHNGCGKSTLMKAMANGKLDGFPPPDELRTVYVAHDLDASEADQSVVDLLATDPLIKGVSREEICRVLSTMGFDEDRQQLTIAALSGGWKMKLALGRAMLMKADILLLDEPTNHMDVTNVAWLVNYLTTIQGVSSIIVSHDSGFLDNVCTDIIHYEKRKLVRYKGNLSEFVKQKPEARAYYDLNVVTLKFVFPAPKALDGILRRDMPIVRLKGVEFTYDSAERPQLEDVNVQCNMESRVAVLGANGAGKSTLIKILTGQYQAQKGTVWRHPNLGIAYVAQHAFHHVEEHLEMSPSQYICWRYETGEDKEEMNKVTRRISKEEQRQMEKMVIIRGEKRNVEKLVGRRKYKKTYEYEVKWKDMHPVHNAWMTRAMLEEMGFQKMIHEVDAQMVAKLGLYNRPLTIAGVQQHLSDFGLEPEFGTYGQIKNLSGGQKVKVVLAAAMWANPHMIVLDEPTNYLDREALGALASALKEYQGAVVVISHNHDFVSSVCTEEWHVGGGKVIAEGNPAYEAAKEKAGKEAKKAAEKAEKEAKKAAR